MPAHEHIVVDTHGKTAFITLNQPDKLNAMSRAMLEELNRAFAAIENDREIRAVLLTGAGRGFCAGADLSGEGLAVGDDGKMDLGEELEEAFNPLIRRIRALSKPVIAAVNGPCAGAGMSLALAADIVIAARSATFLQAFSRIGLIPDAGSTWFLPRLIGNARATAMILLADKIDAEQAAEWGLIWKCVEDEALMDEAASIAERLSQGPTAAYAAARALLQASATNDLDTQLDLERDTQRRMGHSHDFIEGVAAFFQKRPPVFKGE